MWTSPHSALPKNSLALARWCVRCEGRAATSAGWGRLRPPGLAPQRASARKNSLSSRYPLIRIDSEGSVLPRVLRFTRDPRIRHGSILSIFSSSVNETAVAADNQHGHPWGGERESAKMTGLGLPPPYRGLREMCPRLRVGDQASRDRRANSCWEGPRQGRWCWRSDVVQHRPCRPSGECQLTDSIETSTDNLTLHRGHRDDQCGSCAFHERYGSGTSWRLCIRSGSVPEQGHALPPSSDEGVPADPIETVPSSPLQGLALPSGSQQGAGPVPSACAPGQGRSPVVMALRSL